MNAKRPKLDIEVTELINNKETEGFDLQAGQTWVYPTNYSLRDYQYNIIQEALLKNTMVSLPTGLGKTFIAAVVMYNFYRWYPTGKIIFMAPTRPLVKQQVDACYNIMAIPKEVTAELTGTKNQECRKNIWIEKRVFFITPQVLQNDLSVLTELGNKIKCLVIDEAHKAKGNHAYCEVIRKLNVQNKFFRVLALSATPGNTVNDVVEVIENLLISHLEFRTEDSLDVVPFIFERSIETVVVPLDDMLIKVRDDYIKLLEKYTRVLMANKVLVGNCSTLTKGKIYMTMKNYQETNRQNRDRNYNEIMKYLNISHTLYYAFELLLRHGLRSFLLFFQDRVEKSMLNENVVLRNIIQEVEAYMGPLLNIQSLPDGSITGIPENVKFGHPKFYRLRDIATDHFLQENSSETRIIIFCEYRETVMEAYGILSLNQPLIKPRIFMGKSSITQKQQLSVIKAFRDGSCNTLISTSIGEEGIDVGNVDLIICFDINNKSPIRMIQRMGRTGRKRQGRVVILVTEGREQQTLKECLIQKQSLSHHILQSNAFQNDMYKENPRMIPDDLEPKCNKLFITVKEEDNKKAQKNKSKNLKDMFKTIAEDNKNILQNNSEAAIVNVEDRIPTKELYWCKSKEYIKCSKAQEKINFASKINKLRMLQSTGFINHSSNTNLLVSLLQSCESKKFNIPTTQTPMLISQTQKLVKSNTGQGSNSLKQADIRNMFVKPSSSDAHVITGTQSTVDNEQQETKNSLNEEITNYLSTLESDYNNNCELCLNFFDCSLYYVKYKLDFDINTWVEPDPSICDSITEENLLVFKKSLTPSTENSTTVTLGIENIDKVVDENIQSLDVTIKYDFFGDTSGFIESPFKAPRSIQKVLKKCNLFDSPLPSIPFTQLELQNSQINKKNIGADIFSLNLNEFDQAEFTQLKKVENNSCDFSDSLSFFNMTALEEMFENSTHSLSQRSDTTIIYSPKHGGIELDSDSPILSFNKNRSLSSTQIFNKSNDSSLKQKSQNVKQRKTISFSSDEDDNIVDTSIGSPVLSRKSKCVKKDTLKKQLDTFGITDIVDLSVFGLNEAIVSHKTNQHPVSESYTDASKSENTTNHCQKSEIEGHTSKKETAKTLNYLDDFCENSFLEMFYTDPFSEKTNNQSVEPLLEITKKDKSVTESKNFDIQNTKPYQEIETDGNKQWENNIWNYCVDSDTSFDEKKLLKVQDVQKSPNKATNNTELTNKINNITQDVVDLTSDNSLSPPNKSPSLIKSQRYNTQKSLHVNRCINFDDDFTDDVPLLDLCRTNLPNNYSKNVPKTVLTLKKDYKELENCDVFEQSSLFDEHRPSTTKAVSESRQLSPVLNKHKVMDDTFSFKKSNKKLEFSDDDDFELSSTWIRPKAKHLKPHEQQKKLSVNSPKDKQKNIRSKRNNKRTLENCQYIDLEAEVNEPDTSSTDESCFDGSFEKSFVDDNSEGFLNTTVMHVQYLRSVKDANRGQFKIPQLPVSNANVYSQVENVGENTYLNDTFCVNSQTIESDSGDDLSDLEIAEMILANKKKTKRMGNKKGVNQTVKKKRRIILSSDSD